MTSARVRARRTVQPFIDFLDGYVVTPATVSHQSKTISAKTPSRMETPNVDEFLLILSQIYDIFKSSSEFTVVDTVLKGCLMISATLNQCTNSRGVAAVFFVFLSRFRIEAVEMYEASAYTASMCN